MKERLIEAFHKACIEERRNLSYMEIVDIIEKEYMCNDCIGASMNDCIECEEKRKHDL